MSDDETTDPSAPIPKWIEQAVERGLVKVDAVCAKREARMVASESRVLEAEQRMHALKDEILAAEARLIEFIGNVGVKRIDLNQQATEGAQLALSEKLDAERQERLKLEKRVDAIEQWRRDTERCPPPEGAE